MLNFFEKAGILPQNYAGLITHPQVRRTAPKTTG